MIDMRIEKYHITSDPRNFIVAIAKFDETGEPATTETKNGPVLTERVMGFYRSLPYAIRAIAKDMLQNGDERITDLTEYEKKARAVDVALTHVAWKCGVELQKAVPHE